MASIEEKLFYEILRKLDISCVFDIFGGLTEYCFDGTNKFLWLVWIRRSTDTGRHIGC